MDASAPESSHFVAALVGVLSGGGSIGMLSRFMIQNWIKKHEERAETNNTGLQAVALELKGLSVTVAAFGVTLEKIVAKLDKKGEDVAVLSAQVETIKTDLNNLGASVRSIRR